MDEDRICVYCRKWQHKDDTYLVRTKREGVFHSACGRCYDALTKPSIVPKESINRSLV